MPSLVAAGAALAASPSGDVIAWLDGDRLTLLDAQLATRAQLQLPSEEADVGFTASGEVAVVLRRPTTTVISILSPTDLAMATGIEIDGRLRLRAVAGERLLVEEQ